MSERPTLGILVLWRLSGEIHRGSVTEAFESIGLGKAVGKPPRINTVKRRVTSRLGVKSGARFAKAVEMTMAKVYPDELSLMMVGAMEGTSTRNLLGAVPVRTNPGGVYLIPPKHAAQARKMARFIEGASKSSVTCIQIPGTDGNRSGMRTPMVMWFERQMEIMTLETQEYLGGRVTSRGNETRQARFDLLMERAELHSAIVGKDVAPWCAKWAKSMKKIYDALEGVE